MANGLFAPEISPDIGFARPVSPVVNNAGADLFNNLAGLTRLFMQEEGAPNIPQAERDKLEREDFDYALQKAFAANDKTRVRAIIRKAAARFGETDETFNATVKRYTGKDFLQLEAPDVAEMQVLQGYVKDHPLVFLGSRVVYPNTDTMDPVATMQNFKMNLMQEAINATALYTAKNKELGRWLSEDSPKVSVASANFTSMLHNVFEYASKTPLAQADIESFRAMVSDYKLKLTAYLPTNLPEEDRKRFLEPIEAAEKFLGQVTTSENLLKIGNEDRRNRTIKSFLNAIDDPQVRSLMTTIPTDRWADYFMFLQGELKLTPKHQQALLKALEQADVPTFNPITATPESAKPSLFSDEISKELAAVPVERRYQTAVENAELFASMDPASFKDANQRSIAYPMMAKTFALVGGKEGFNFTPSLQKIFSPTFVNNYKQITKADPEAAVPLAISASIAVRDELVKHQIAFDALLTNNPQIKLVDGQFYHEKSGDSPLRWSLEGFPFLGQLSKAGFAIGDEIAIKEMTKHQEAIKFLNTLGPIFDLPKEIFEMTTDPTSSLPLGEKLLPLIDKYEGAGNYNAYLDHPNNTEIKFTEMTVDEVLQWQKDERARTGRPSAAVGRYQIIETTLRDLKRTEGLSGNEFFNSALQDALYQALLNRRVKEGASTDVIIKNLRKEWQGLQKVPDATLANVLGG